MGDEFNFSFAFNDLDFSDRILRLEITPDDEDDDSTAPRKKLKGDKNDDIHSKDSKSSINGGKVTTLHISSPVLASKSPFFYKLFKNGMRESQNKNEVSLKISASEEATLIDLIRFMHGKTALNATSYRDFVDLLIAADKFEVTSCMTHCVEMLLKFPMSLESALFYLEHPSSVVKPLINSSKKYIAALHRDFTNTHQKAMQLPLFAIELVLGSEGLQVVSEDFIFDFVLKWARASYPELEQRRGILTNRLAQLICFPNMSVRKLKEVLDCAEFDHENVSKLVMEALFSKVEQSCGQILYTSNSKDQSTNGCCYAGRVYNPHRVVFFDIKKNRCAALHPSNVLHSPKFRVGGTQFYLSVDYKQKKLSFGLYVVKAFGYSETCTVDFEISVMKKSSREFESKVKVNNDTVGVDNGWECSDLLGITWTELMSDDSDYFIDGVLRFRTDLTLLKSC